MPHLLNVWTSVAPRLSDAPGVLLLLDYDGTLAPIAPRPELAVLPAAARRVLADLSVHPRFRPGIISGRGLSDLRERVGVPGIIYAGNHGLEIIGAGDDFVHPQAAGLRPALERVGSELQSRLAGYPGVLVEDKGLTLSVHYRQTDTALVPPVERTFDDVVSAAPVGLKVTRGKMVLEVRPDVAWGKGNAIAKLMEGYIEGYTEGYTEGYITWQWRFASARLFRGRSWQWRFASARLFRGRPDRRGRVRGGAGCQRHCRVRRPRPPTHQSRLPGGLPGRGVGCPPTYARPLPTQWLVVSGQWLEGPGLTTGQWPLATGPRLKAQPTARC